MTRETMADFVLELKRVLAEASLGLPPSKYLNLSNLDFAWDLRAMTAQEAPPQLPLAEALEIILEKIRYGQVDKVKLGINEFLKAFLIQVNSENEKSCTQLYLSRLLLIFRRCLVKDFPYNQEIWDYLSNCLNNCGLYLIHHHMQIAARELLDTFFHLGKLAAQEGLQTSTTQGFLRVLEEASNRHGFPDLASTARNFRFNLELY